MSARRRRLAAGLLLAAGVLAAPAEGAVVTFGSDLSRSATLEQAFGSDTVYWQLPGEGGVAVPEDGEIRGIELKGYAKSDRQPGQLGGGGETMFHFQSLTQRSDRSVQVRQTNGPFYVPNRNVAGPDTVTRYETRRFCVRRGELIAFNNIGGYGEQYPYGTAMQIFASVPGSIVSHYTKGGGTGDGAVLAPREQTPDRELLMRMTLATGDDRTADCGGPAPPATTPPPPTQPPVTPPPPTGGDGDGGATLPPARVSSGKRARVRRGVVTFSVYCSKDRDCAGAVRLRAKRKQIGRRRFTIAAGDTETVRLRLTKAGRRMFRRGRGRLTATATVTAEPGGDANVQRFRLKLRRR